MDDPASDAKYVRPKVGLGRARREDPVEPIVTYVTTQGFLLVFDLQSLRDLPDMEMLEDAGLGG